MREILFRGKDVDRKEWVYGGYSLYPHTRFPCKPTIYEVDRGCWHPVEVIPDTVGQYTGKDDKNGTKIFEGDLVQAVMPSTKAMGGFEWPLMPVVFRGGIFGLLTDRDEIVPFANYAPAVTLEVKGNIHDHPEMLKGANANEG